MKFLSTLMVGAACLGLAGFPGHAQMVMPKPAVPAPVKTLNVAFLVYPGVEILDLSGPLDVFVKANDVVPHAFNLYTVAAQSPTIASQSGVLTLTARYNLQNSPRPDIVIVPGASLPQVEELASDARVLKWLRKNASPSQKVMSVCTGAFLLGRAGLLDGKKSTSHRFVLDDLQRQNPKARVFQGVSCISDGNIFTTAGVSSGIDGAFVLLEKIKGAQVAQTVAEAIQYRRSAASFPAQKAVQVTLQKPSPALKPGQKLASRFDPVCGMPLKANPVNLALYQNQVFGFCSAHCREQFAANPAKYLKNSPLTHQK